MKPMNKIGFDYINKDKSAEPTEKTEEKELSMTVTISPAHAVLKGRIEATEEFLTTPTYKSLSKTDKKYHIETLIMLVALDAELNVRSGIGYETSVQDLRGELEEVKE